MASHKNRDRETASVAGNGRGPRDFTFVRYSLDSAEKGRFIEWAETIDGVPWDDVESLLLAGYKVSLSYSDANRNVCCTISCNAPKDPNIGLLLTSFHESAYTALLLGLWKHYELFEDFTWVHKDPGQSWG